MRVLKAISGVLLVFLIISIIPSLVFAVENNTSSDYRGFFAGDFATVKSKVLNHLNDEISRLQGVSANVSAANNMAELQTALGRDRMSRHHANRMSNYHGDRMSRHHGMNIDGNDCGLVVGGGFGLSEIAAVNDTTFPTVKANMVSSLQNMNAVLQDKEIRATAHNNTEKATYIAGKIVVIQNLTDQINLTTDAAGLQATVLKFMKGQLDNAINERITQLKNLENSTTDANMKANINTKIVDLNTLETNINNATSLSDLQQVLYSSNIMAENNYDSKCNCEFRGHHGRCGGMKDIY